MGHIVNAKSMRIGWSTIWCDQWFSEILYYPEYLHSIFRIRFYLIYVFTRRHFDKKAIFYSHFEILRHYKNVYVEVYYYSGKLENDYEEFKFEFFFKLYYDLECNKDIETRQSRSLYAPLKLLIIWNWIHIFRIKKFSSQKFIILYKLAAILNNYKIIEIKQYLFLLAKKGYILTNDMFLVFLLLFSLYVYAKYHIGKWSVWKSPKRNTILRRFYILTGSYRWMHSFVFFFGTILGYIFQKLTRFNKVIVSFFLTNNNCVNAKFLSRFIARKLKQNYPVKQLINPIRKELLYVMRLTSCPRKSYNINANKKYVQKVNNKNFRKSMFKFLLINLFYMYTKHLLYFFFKEKTWITLDMLIINIWFNINLINNIDLVLVSKKYFLRKCAYLCFFEMKITLDLVKNIFLPKVNYLSFFSQKSKYLGLFNYIYEYLYVNKLNLLNLYYFDIFFKANAKILRSSCVNFNRYLKFNYWKYNYEYTWASNELNLNNLKSRIKIHTRANNICGYKMYLSGRFSRKQRSGYFWFSRGKVPLNTITAFIDYAFFTLSLRNSAVTVKVWLYKSDDVLNTYYLKIC